MSGSGQGGTMPFDPAFSDLDIRGLTADSRLVEPGFLFAALPGTKTDGGKYVADAVGRGATAVLGPPGLRLDSTRPGVALIADENPRRRLALMAARFYGRQPATVAAVTGTNGKTSVVSFCRQIWSHLGRQAASYGTGGIDAPTVRKKLPLTTPDPVALHRDLAELADAGVDHLAIEASSHGIDQFRLDGVTLTAAAFTNLTRDHLDYHGSMAAYLKAKLRLFDVLLPAGGVAVLNADSSEWQDFANVCKARGHRVINYGKFAKRQDVRLIGIEPKTDGMTVSLIVQERPVKCDLPLVGAFQAMNALAALGLVLGCGGDRDAAAAALPRLQGAPGRLQRVAVHPNGAAIYVDYAHTPDALETVLRALRPHCSGRLVVVFGCGGDRDPGKRPMMGEVAARLANRTIVTDDNPRSEQAAAIRKAILVASPGAYEIGDRAEAIERAIRDLEPEDLLVIAGKGHESGQIVGDEVLPFDDADVARSVVRSLGGQVDG
jgi:UDP-N-acetylmuramoyl-L-alanyl-D-glutamate--2,6-diaminopimelate ligase